MRTRERTIVLSTKSVPAVGTCNQTHTLCNGSLGSTGNVALSAWNISSKVLSEYMVDSPSGRAAPHPVLHRSFTWEIPDLEASYVWGQANGQGGYVRWGAQANTRWMLGYYNRTGMMRTWYLNQAASLPYRWAIDQTPINESALIEDCFEKAKQLKADGLLNIVEGNQIWTAIRSIARCNPEAIFHFWKKAKRSAMKGNMKRYVSWLHESGKVPAAAYLGYQFGIAPLVHDIGSAVQYSRELQGDLRKYYERETSRFSSIAERPISFDSSSQTIATDLQGYGIEVMLYEGVVNKAPTVRYVLVAKPTRKFRTEVFKTLGRVVDRFTTSPASLAWELVPFSFVVDWFVDLRGMCRAIDNALGVSPFEVVAFTRSFSYSVDTKGYLETRSACPGTPPLHRGLACSSSAKHYERSLVSPGATLPTWKPRFGKKQAALSAALLTVLIGGAKRVGR